VGSDSSNWLTASTVSPGISEAESARSNIEDESLTMSLGISGVVSARMNSGASLRASTMPSRILGAESTRIGSGDLLRASTMPFGT